VIAARSPRSFEKEMQRIRLDPEGYYDVVDVTGEGWSFSAKHMVISPLTIKKRWFKKDVIVTYNNRKNVSNQEKKYSDKSLSSKRFERIFCEIVDLLEN